MINQLKNIFDLLSGNYNIIITIISICILIWGVYQKVKFLCLKKASEIVADIEERDDLTGEEKFAQCILWINNELPKIFKNSMFKSLLEKVTNFAYETSFKYMKNYVKRKTGYDISQIIEQIINHSKETEKE